MTANIQTKNNLHLILESIRSNVPLHGLKWYLADLFSDMLLQARSDNQALHISFFQDFIPLPLFISKRIFHTVKKNTSDYLKKSDFVEGLCALYAGTLYQQVKTAFQIFDFNEDGLIEYDDVLLVLCHLHFLKLTDSTIEEVVCLVEKSFNGKKELDYDSYLDHIANVSSDFILLFLFFISRHRPYNEDSVKYYSECFVTCETNERRESKKSVFSSESTTWGGSFIEEFINGKCIEQCSMKLCAPSKYLLNYLIDYYDMQVIDDELENDICLLNTFEEDMTSMIKLLDHNTEVEQSKIREDTPNTFKKKIDLKLPFKALLCGSPENRITNTSNTRVNNTSLSSQLNIAPNNSWTRNDTAKHEIILWRISKKNRLKKQKLVILNDILFFYKYQDCSDLFTFKGIINLRSTYVEKCYEVVVENNKYYPFQLISNLGFKNFQYNFLCQTEDDMRQAVSVLHNAKRFQRIQECYDIREEIGHGQFGKIHLGVSKLTQEKVAIKILRKKMFKEAHFQMVRNEIDIFKFLKNTSNPYLIKAKDYYETQNSIYLVFEYFPNGNLNEFLYTRREIMSLCQLKTILGQIVEGIKFLHRFGIMHRDLKPDNILISQVNAKFSQVKIIDFGLSKICGKNERSSESFGSLCFTGPEVLLDKSYDHRVDIWSFGVIVYYLKYAVLPFDDISNEPKAIVKKIVSTEVKFPRLCHSDAQDYEVEFQAIIKHCLVKNFERRMNINDISRKWFYL